MAHARRSPYLTLIALAALLASPAHAELQCQQRSHETARPAVNFRVDNDLFGAKHQDQGYTNGAVLSFVSPNLENYADDPCLPRLARWVNGYLQPLQSDEFDQQNMIFMVGQALFTPTDPTRSGLIPDDRPYAGILLMSFGYNARIGNHLRTTQLQVGILGPSAQGKQLQQAVHRVLGDEKFLGWDNQLRDEPLLNIVHERMQRWAPANVAQGWGWDAIGHWGGALGNMVTYAGIGGEARFGWKLPDDFGSSPLRPAGENTAPPRRGPATGWSAHLFVTSDSRWVLRDITLDGNTFRRSHRVDKRPFVNDIGYGLALMHGQWKFALSRVHRSREFDQQQENPVFGSFTISRVL